MEACCLPGMGSVLSKPCNQFDVCLGEVAPWQAAAGLVALLGADLFNVCPLRVQASVLVVAVPSRTSSTPTPRSLSCAVAWWAVPTRPTSSPTSVTTTSAARWPLTTTPASQARLPVWPQRPSAGSTSARVAEAVVSNGHAGSAVRAVVCRLE